MSTEEIINELIAADPTLADQRTQLEKIVPELTANRPDARVDADFRTALRNRLLAEPVVSTVQGLPLRNRFLKYGAVATTCLALLLLAGWGTYYVQQRRNSTLPQPGKLAIHQVGAGAFGKITLNNDLTAPMDSRAEGIATSLAPDSATSSSTGSGSVSASGSSIAYPYPTPPSQYTVEDSVLSNLPTTVDVLKQTPTLQGVANLFSLNLPTGPTVSSVTAYTVHAGDFDVQVDLRYGSIWFTNTKLGAGKAVPLSLAGDTKATPNNTLIEPVYPSPTGAEEVSDAEALSIADSFVKSIGLKTAFFGQPVVHNASYGNPEARFYYGYYPSVVYPLTIAGVPVVDSTGNPLGVTIQISSRDHAVSSASVITTFEFDQSQYTVNRDSFKKQAEQGGGFYYGYYPASTPEETPTPTKLENPTLVYLQQGRTNPDTGYFESLLLPAYSFSISPEAGAYKLVVPLPDVQN